MWHWSCYISTIQSCSIDVANPSMFPEFTFSRIWALILIIDVAKLTLPSVQSNASSKQVQILNSNHSLKSLNGPGTRHLIVWRICFRMSKIFSHGQHDYCNFMLYICKYKELESLIFTCLNIKCVQIFTEMSTLLWKNE